MPYPDENGHHLEVINFQTGYGALEVRGRRGADPRRTWRSTPPRDHDKPAAVPLTTSTYALFVVGPASTMSSSGADARGTWHPRIDVPLDRTRLWIVP